jgi:hypothetical protein
MNTTDGPALQIVTERISRSWQAIRMLPVDPNRVLLCCTQRDIQMLAVTYNPDYARATEAASRRRGFSLRRQTEVGRSRPPMEYAKPILIGMALACGVSAPDIQACANASRLEVAFRGHHRDSRTRPALMIVSGSMRLYGQRHGANTTVEVMPELEKVARWTDVPLLKLPLR